MKETDPFTADEAEFLYADADDFASAVENGKVVVELKATKMIDIGRKLGRRGWDG
ncbi:MAG: hypothetical protein II838_00700 [Lachnospiraceae bacterium]|nr:hypothetical protein [Lachnospiraceae bacterium]